jgi:hypothetical protein
VRRPGHHAAAAARIERAGHAEVAQHRPVRLHDQVLRLDVAVHDADPVGGGQRGAQLHDQIELAAERQRRLVGGVDGAQQVAQGPPAQELHGDEQLIAMLAEVVHPAHVGVRHPAGQPHLGAQSLPVVRVARQLRVQELEGDRLVELAVVHFIDRAHAPFAERPDDLVAAGQHLAGIDGLPVGGANTRGRPVSPPQRHRR